MTGRVALLLALLAGRLPAQDAAPPVPALPELPASVRSAGLAGISVALPGDAAVVFSNPSAIGPIRRLAIEASYSRLPDDRWYTTGAAALRVGAFGMGGGYRYLRYAGGGPVTDNLQWVGALTARLRGVHFGAAANYVSLEDSAGTIFRTLTEDAGVTVAFFDIAAVALSFENLGRTPSPARDSSFPRPRISASRSTSSTPTRTAGCSPPSRRHGRRGGRGARSWGSRAGRCSEGSGWWPGSVTAGSLAAPT